MKQTLFLCIPNHIFSSDLLRTKYIEYLSSKYKVVVVSPFLNKDSVMSGNYFKNSDVEYVQYDLCSQRFWKIFKFLRICLVNEFDYLVSIKHWYKRPNYKDNRLRKLVRTAGLPFRGFFTANFFTFIESKLLPKSDIFSKLLSNYKPSLIITATPGFDSWEAEIILLSKRVHIPTIAINFSWDNLTMNSKHIRKTDYLIAWNGVMKKEAEDIHKYLSENVWVSGVPRFDPYFSNDFKSSREEFLKSKKLNPKYKTIFHTTVTKAYPFQKKYIKDLITMRANSEIPYVNLFIRIHPLDIFENYSEFLGIPDLYIEKAGHEFSISGAKKIEMSYNDLLNLRNSLQYTDLNINYASTISIESCIFNKPIINIGYIDRFALAYEFNHYEPIYKSGAVRLAKNNGELAKFINMYLSDPSIDSENRKGIVEKFVSFTDGLSYQRSVDFLADILKN